MPMELVQFQAMQRGDYFCIYALDTLGQLWEREVPLSLEGSREESAIWRKIPGPKP
jgi:hypothetical protein